tara:strand:- start:206 stop:340 length:135 start_codon:yes stop_codon:yes gene_type:complete
MTMKTKDDDYNAIWSTWFVDRLFIVQEMARKREKIEKNKKETKK